MRTRPRPSGPRVAPRAPGAFHGLGGHGYSPGVRKPCSIGESGRLRAEGGAWPKERARRLPVNVPPLASPLLGPFPGAGSIAAGRVTPRGAGAQKEPAFRSHFAGGHRILHRSRGSSFLLRHGVSEPGNLQGIRRSNSGVRVPGPSSGGGTYLARSMRLGGSSPGMRLPGAPDNDPCTSSTALRPIHHTPSLHGVDSLGVRRMVSPRDGHRALPPVSAGRLRGGGAMPSRGSLLDGIRRHPPMGAPQGSG